MRVDDVRRLWLGSFVRPADETSDGSPRVEPVYGYAVRHDAGLLLVDTGIGAADPETEAWYRPVRVPLAQALAEQLGLGLDDVTEVSNCHLHFDHCGGNPLLAGRPVLCQRAELETARAGNYTVDSLVDFAGVAYEVLDGQDTVRPGIHVLPTPGHVAGHQSVLVSCDDGTVVVAGQAYDTTSQWSAAALAARAAALGHAPPLPEPPPWVETLLAYDPSRVVFAHDSAVWVPD